MEEERLARLKKRSAPDSQAEYRDRRQRLKPNTNTDIATAGNLQLSPSQYVSQLQPRVVPVVEQYKTGPDLKYPRGVVKRTFVKGHPKLSNDITIEEILQKDELQLAVLSSFQWDEEWLMSKVRPETKLILVAFAPDDATVCSPCRLFCCFLRRAELPHSLDLFWAALLLEQLCSSLCCQYCQTFQRILDHGCKLY